MDVKSIIEELKTKFGNTFNVEKVEDYLKGIDTSKFSMSEIVDKIKNNGLIGDLDGDGVKEGFFEEIKGKVSNMFKKD